MNWIAIPLAAKRAVIDAARQRARARQAAAASDDA